MKTYHPILICSLPISLSAPTLWQRTVYGMSPKEVQALMPEAIDPMKAGSLADGSIELLQIDDLIVIPNHFSVHFYFLNEKLQQVTLALKTGKKDTFHTCMLTFDSLSDVLREKYGIEISQKKAEYGGYRSSEADWMSGKTNISILLLDVYGLLTLNINYQVRISKESE